MTKGHEWNVHHATVGISDKTFQFAKFRPQNSVYKLYVCYYTLDFHGLNVSMILFCWSLSTHVTIISIIVHRKGTFQSEFLI